MTALDRKLVRNLRELRGQVITIALVVACGIAAFVTLRSTWDSLQSSRDTYYERYRFADVFAHAKRAPEYVRQRLEAIPGVALVHSRLVEPVMLPMPDLPEPASGRIVSIPGSAPVPLNEIVVLDGRRAEPGQSDEVVLLASFAAAHGLEPGDSLPAVINGTFRDLTVVGTAASPEFVMAMAPGDISPDPARFAVLWIDRDTVASAFDLTGAFDDVVLRLQPDADVQAVLAAVDRELEPYGGTGAIPRERQLSHLMLTGELTQLSGMAAVLPVMFLGVAAFLLNVVLSRVILLQRGEIAALKALGYSDSSISLHFLKLVSAIVLGGALMGLPLGAWLGTLMTNLYAGFFHFPVLAYRLDPWLAAVSVAISLAAAVLGALGAVVRVASLPPAEAMRPPAPVAYRRGWLERLGLFRLIDPGSRMVAREVQRRPLRFVLSACGIGMGVALLVVGRSWGDAFEEIIYVQLGQAMRDDYAVSMTDPLPERAVRELTHLPGVLRGEGLREVPVRFVVGPRHRDAALVGYPDDGALRQVLDVHGEPVALPSQGALLSRKLGEILDVGPGDRVNIELREGDRSTRSLLVAQLIDDSMGLQAYIRRSVLDDVLGEEPTVTTVLLAVDPKGFEAGRGRLKELPRVASVTRTEALSQRFIEQSGAMLTTFTLILTAFASVIAIGVVYNNARIALSMRSRELASLRVLGFTRAEISSILLGELAVEVILAIPIGVILGTWLVELMMSSVDPETYRLPVVISLQSYAYAAVVTLVAGALSGLLVRRKLDRLDLIGVLKTRE